MKKFYEFKNISPSTADLFIYGEIVQEKSVDYWTGEESQTDVGLMDFKKELDDIGNVQKINLYINSPGGDVFTASTMISMLQRKKDAGAHIDAYVDGLSASAASFLMMVADNLYLYKNSTVMVHKPMSWAVGNAIDMQKTIDALNKIEENVMLPMYMNKSKVSEDEIRSLINDETWLSASDMDKYFNVTILNEEKVAVANIHSNLFKNYHNVPDFIKKSLKNEEKEQKKEKNSPKIDEKTLEIDKKESISTENQSKEQEIKAKLGLIKSSLIIKKMKERNDVNE
ncbi:MAG TPA: Clp protease ClpP [Candidatus Fimihabitans intestinipullorum]|uniref:Clp protease ClpP n=1 Tax=Candidatus Fimihabitans intestinipullorum TaxID=2840820 RepID=A0A9D1L3Z6_9BACT|nr:Clp protease ClpP [Candidatus Fimihabitans intestinipullorum]